LLREFYSRYIPEQIRYKEEIIQINPFYETEESVRQVLYKGYKGMNMDKIQEGEEKSLVIVDSLRKYSGQKNAESIWNANQETVKYANELGKKGVSIVGDMGSFLFEKRMEELVNYELQLPRRFEINLKGICLYHLKDFDRLTEYQKQTIINLHEIAIRL
jgi:F0F1-type ATP synthase gamma subunit